MKNKISCEKGYMPVCEKIEIKKKYSDGSVKKSTKVCGCRKTDDLNRQFNQLRN